MKMYQNFDTSDPKSHLLQQAYKIDITSFYVLVRSNEWDIKKWPNLLKISSFYRGLKKSNNLLMNVYFLLSLQLRVPQKCPLGSIYFC